MCVCRLWCLAVCHGNTDKNKLVLESNGLITEYDVGLTGEYHPCWSPVTSYSICSMYENFIYIYMPWTQSSHVKRRPWSKSENATCCMRLAAPWRANQVYNLRNLCVPHTNAITLLIFPRRKSLWWQNVCYVFLSHKCVYSPRYLNVLYSINILYIIIYVILNVHAVYLPNMPLSIKPPEFSIDVIKRERYY